MPLAALLKQLRERAGLTQRALSIDLDVVERTIANYESGDQVPRADTLSRWLDVCGATDDERLTALGRKPTDGAEASHG